MKTDNYANTIIYTLIFLLLTVSCKRNSETKGTIIGSTINPIIGHGWSAMAWYEYEVEKQLYRDTIYFHGDDKIMMKGDTINIIYKAHNPAKNKVKY